MQPFEVWLVWWAFLFAGAAVTSGTLGKQDAAAFYMVTAFLTMMTATLVRVLK